MSDLPVQKSGEGSQEGMLPAASVANSVTTGGGAVDAGGDLVSKLQTDLNKMKSTFQKQLAQQEKEFRKREQELQDRVRKAQIASASDEDRVKLERQMEEEQLEQVRRQKEEIESQLEEINLRQQWTNFYQSIGVQPKVDGSLDELFESGQAELARKVQEQQRVIDSLRSEVAGKIKETVTSPVPQPVTPPKVDIGNSGSPVTPSLADLLKQHGGMDALMTKIERTQNNALAQELIEAIALQQSKE